MSSHQLTMRVPGVYPRDTWATPQYLFDQLNSEVNFTIDGCALSSSAKMVRYWSPSDDAIIQDWSKEKVFVNPPFSNIAVWVEKCKTARLACLLVPVFSDNTWWHECLSSAVVIDFFRGRIQFIPPKEIKASTCNGRHCLIWFGDVWHDPRVRWRSRDAKTGRLI